MRLAKAGERPAVHLLRNGAWFAACDGGKATLLENKGDVEYPNLVRREVMRCDNPPARLQASTPPGRTFSSTDGRRAALSQSDLHEQTERNFLRRFAGILNQAVQEKSIKALTLDRANARCHLSLLGRHTSAQSGRHAGLPD